MCLLRRSINLNNFYKVNYLIYSICFALLMYQSIDLIIEFMSGKTVINISVENNRNTSLPGVTICPYSLDFSRLSLSNKNVSKLYDKYLKLIENANRSRISDIKKYLDELYNKALDIYFNSNENNIKIKEILNNLTPFMNNIDEKMFSSVFYLASAYGEIDEDLIHHEGYYFKNYFMRSFPMESLWMSNRKNFPNIAKCYTLFGHSESSWNKIKMVFARFIINLKLDYHSQPITSSLYIGMVMHSPNTLPFEGFSYINPGFHYIFKFSKLNVVRLGKGYDTDCREYDTKKYTRNDCIFDCYQLRAKYYCQTEDIVSFRMLKKKIYFEQSNLNFSKCNIKIKNIHRIFEYCYGQCNRECHITYYSYTIIKLKEIDMYQINFEFKHNQMPDLSIRHIPEMSILTLICNFGGILGMWLGVSFVDISNRFLEIFKC